MLLFDFRGGGVPNGSRSHAKYYFLALQDVDQGQFVCCKAAHRYS